MKDIELLKETSDIKKCDNFGRSVIHYYSMAHNIKNLEVLLNKIENCELQKYLTSTDYYGNTALTLCCIESISNTKHTHKEECIKFFVENTENLRLLNYGNKLNLTPIHWLSFWNERQCLNILLNKNIPSYIPSFDGVYPIDLAGK